MTNRPRVFADFNDLLSAPTRLWLDTVGAKADLERQGVQLREGLELLLYDHDADAMGRRNDLVVEGVVSRDPATGRWMATVDPDAIRNESSDSGAE
jgi:hypothetical protein